MSASPAARRASATGGRDRQPFGLGGTVTAGIVSARGRDIGAVPYDDFLQVDAPINKGTRAARPSTSRARSSA